MPVFSKGLNNTSPYRMAINSNGAVWGAVRDAAGVESVQSAGGVVPFGEWTHLALVADRDAGSLVLYVNGVAQATRRSEEHTSELQSLMRISYAVFCVKKKIDTEVIQIYC